MSVTGSKPTVSEEVVIYSSKTKLAELANEIAASQKFSKVTSKILQATKIRLWLKALEYGDFLTREQREKIWWFLIDVADINDFGISPLLATTDQPSILAGSTINTYVTNNYLGGTDFENTDVDTGTEVVDSFSITLASGVRWDYTISDGTNQRSGTFITTWLSDGTISDGADISSPDIGDTSDVVLSCDYSAGQVRLIGNATSNGWTIQGKRYLI